MNIRNLVQTNNHESNFLDKVSIHHFVYYKDKRQRSLYAKEMKKPVKCGPYACVLKGNVNALRLSEIPTTLNPRIYIMICKGIPLIPKVF